MESSVRTTKTISLTESCKTWNKFVTIQILHHLMQNLQSNVLTMIPTGKNAGTEKPLTAQFQEINTNASITY